MSGVGVAIYIKNGHSYGDPGNCKLYAPRSLASSFSFSRDEYTCIIRVNVFSLFGVRAKAFEVPIPQVPQLK